MHKTHCRIGHAMTPENIYTRIGRNNKPYHVCKACRSMANHLRSIPLNILEAGPDKWDRCNRCATPIPMKKQKINLEWLTTHKKGCKVGF